MRNLKIIACLATIACAGGTGGANSATARPGDSVVVSGPPAVPSTETPPPESARTPVARPGASTNSPPAPPPTPTSTTTPRADSVRGIVSVVGTSFEKHVMVAPASGGRRMEITGPLATLVGRVAGAEVSVAGTSSGTQLEASRFVVRSVDGQPAIDGTLRTEAGALYIVTENGSRTRIATPPSPLVGRDGARVWITGDPAKGVQSFGFIDPPR
jgi:hypothetical protein